MKRNVPELPRRRKKFGRRKFGNHVQAQNGRNWTEFNLIVASAEMRKKTVNKHKILKRLLNQSLPALEAITEGIPYLDSVIAVEDQMRIENRMRKKR